MLSNNEEMLFIFLNIPLSHSLIVLFKCGIA